MIILCIVKCKSSCKNNLLICANILHAIILAGFIPLFIAFCIIGNIIIV